MTDNRHTNFRKQPCGSPESSQYSRRTASLSRPSLATPWLRKSYDREVGKPDIRTLF